ncbi:MAG: FG-GAP-like repeat-containing protein, partial [Verrucomicrobiota bacterium]|nr:FG-GAP-like repeat-containing protein [Verrucomicrobiota bacterium]
METKSSGTGTLLKALALGLLAITCPATEAVGMTISTEGSPWLKLRNAAPSIASGPENGPGLALAAADFDEDGVADLVSGFGSAAGGFLTVQRGNVDAIYPHSAEAKERRQRGEYIDSAFYPASRTIALPEAAEFLGAGDFDADGHWDVVAARSGSTRLYWLRGDGRGNLGEANAIELTGAVTALATGEVNRVDGLTDLVVGIVAANGARALVFESPEGALRRAPESLALAAPANSIAVGQLGRGDSKDVAIAAGNEVIIVSGRDRKLSQDATRQAEVHPAEMTQTTFDSAVTSIAIGDFTGDAGQELAALTSDGSLRVLNQDTAAPIPGGNNLRVNARMTLQSANSSADGSKPVQLLAAKVSALPKDDLLLVGGTNAVQIVTVREADPRDGASQLSKAGSERISLAASLTAESEVTAVLPMRLNSDALSDLVSLSKEGGPPVVIESHGAGIFVVNATGNTNDKLPGDGVCEDTTGNCTFSAAIQESNAHPGADTINFNLPGGGPHTLSPNFGQSFDQPVTVDGTTQPIGRVEIVANGFFPFQFYGGNSVLRGISTYANGTAIFLVSDGNIVEGNYIGFRSDGTKPIGFGTSGSGITFRGGPNSAFVGNNNFIGGTTAQARNVISNCQNAFQLSGAGNVIRGNYIGTNVAGTAALSNGRAFFVDSAPDVTIGGATAGAGNLISGNTAQQTILIGLAAAIIQGNYIGTTADGTQPIANGGIAIDIGGDKAVTIGGTAPSARNVIAASSLGIRVAQSGSGSALVQGNFIGTNAAGTGALPNLSHGVILEGSNAVVGGAVSG